MGWGEGKGVAKKCVGHISGNKEARLGRRALQGLKARIPDKGGLKGRRYMAESQSPRFRSGAGLKTAAT
jgi:hypothetical protein